MVSDAPSNLGAASEVAVKCSGTCTPSQQAVSESAIMQNWDYAEFLLSQIASLSQILGWVLPGEVWFY